MRIIDDLRMVLTRDNIRRCVVYCLLPAAIFYGVAVAVMSLAGFTMVEILRDTAQITKLSSFLGFLSSIGTWLWVSAAAICFFTASTYQLPSPNRHRKLLLLCGGFSLWLGIDDFFLIHDRFLAEGLLIPLYAIFVITLLVKYREMIMHVDGLAFLTAGGMLALSVVVDAVQEMLPVSYGLSQFFEEGFKFLGAAGWLYFCYRLAAHPASALLGVGKRPSAR